MTPRKVAITAGGTGGHFFPAVALAEALGAAGFEVVLITDQRTSFSDIAFSQNVVLKRLSLPQLKKGLGLFRFALGALWQMIPLWRWLGKTGIHAVVGFGGYTAVPLFLAAWLRRVPLVLHEQNGLLGRVNRLFARVAASITTAFPTTLGLPQGCEKKVERTGTPVREAFSQVTRAPVNLDAQLKIVVLGGSQGARVMREHVAPVLAGLPTEMRARLTVYHQARPEDMEAVLQLYHAAGVQSEVKSFFTNVPELLAQATLAITRAGAATIGELLAVGCPVLLIPYPWAMDDHQTVNANMLVKEGGGSVLLESSTLSDRLAQTLLNMLKDQQGLAEMTSRLHAIRVPDATQRLVQAVSKVISARG